MAAKWFHVVTKFEYPGMGFADPLGKIESKRLGQKAATEQINDNREWCNAHGHRVISEIIEPCEPAGQPIYRANKMR